MRIGHWEEVRRGMGAVFYHDHDHRLELGRRTNAKAFKSCVPRDYLHKRSVCCSYGIDSAHAAPVSMFPYNYWERNSVQCSESSLFSSLPSLLFSIPPSSYSPHSSQTNLLPKNSPPRKIINPLNINARPKPELINPLRRQRLKARYRIPAMHLCQIHQFRLTRFVCHF